MPLKLMYITNQPEVALAAERAGIDRIWVDLETLGKGERQANRNTVKSNHSVEDIKRIKPLLSKATMLVRINPMNPASHTEIENVLKAGADIIMLPMWKTVDDVSGFISMVGSRARVCLLLETKEAQECIDEVLELDGIDEIHIGLNDLHISHGMKFMFELLADGTVEELCGKIKKKKLPYGFGGIAQLEEGTLPAKYIIAEHYRLGSSMVILSRSFCNTQNTFSIAALNEIFMNGVQNLREYEASLLTRPPQFFLDNQKQVAAITNHIVNSIKK